MDKKKIRQFYGYIVFIVLLCVLTTGYGFVTNSIARFSEAQARIAEVQPQIEIAKGQRAIDNAVAMQTRIITLESTVLSILPYVALICYVYKKERERKNEEIQEPGNITYTTDD